MTVHALKPAFQKVLRPAAGAAARAGLTANQVTLGAIALSVGWAIATWLAGGAPVLFALLLAILLARLALNALDGLIAREHGQASPLGAWLNEAGDVVSDTAVILPFALVEPFTMPWMLAIAALAAIAELAGMRPLAHGGARCYDGPMGKAGRAVVLAMLGTMVWTAGGLSPVLYWFQPVMCVSLAVTIRNRMCAGRSRKAGSDVRL